MWRFIAGLLKLAVASTLVGAGLSLFGLSMQDIQDFTGITPEKLAAAWSAVVEWALPKMALGALVVIPIWFAVFLLRPPGRID